MNYKAVLFDLDGTLLDTLGDLTASANAALAANDMPPRTLDEVRRFVGNGIRNLILRCVPPDTEPARIEQVLGDFKAHYAAHTADTTTVYPQAAEILAVLNRAGIKTAVVSNKADFAVQTLKARFFPELVTYACGEQPGIRRKPAPDMIALALSQLGVERQQALYVGDSDVDAETAKNAGLDCVLVDWGFREREQLMRLARPVVSTAEEFLLVLFA